jgi:hypothetical protein
MKPEMEVNSNIIFLNIGMIIFKHLLGGYALILLQNKRNILFYLKNYFGNFVVFFCQGEGHIL